MPFQNDTQAGQYLFWATGDAAYVMWPSHEERDAWVKKVQGWYAHAMRNSGVFPDGSRIPGHWPQPPAVSEVNGLLEVATDKWPDFTTLPTLDGDMFYKIAPDQDAHKDDFEVEMGRRGESWKDVHNVVFCEQLGIGGGGNLYLNTVWTTYHVYSRAGECCYIVNSTPIPGRLAWE